MRPPLQRSVCWEYDKDREHRRARGDAEREGQQRNRGRAGPAPHYARAKADVPKQEQLGDASVLLFGRATYEGMAAYWTTSDDDLAPAMNDAPKAVVSTTLRSADWNNTRLLHSLDEVARLKREAGDKTVYVFGSAKLTSSLREAGMVDEYRICSAPILLGATGGAPMFKPGDGRLSLRLIEARPITGGGVILRYEPARSGTPDEFPGHLHRHNVSPRAVGLG